MNSAWNIAQRIMSNKNTVLMKRLGRAIKAARKRLGLMQTEVSQSLGISQSQLAKFEMGLAIPNAIFISNFCQYTGISPNALVTDGYFDCAHSPITIDSNKESGGFKLPLKYARSKGTGVRAARFFLEYIESFLGTEKAESFVNSLGLDYAFFACLDNVISFQFTIDTFNYLIEEKLVTPKTIKNLSRITADLDKHGKLSNEFISCNSSLELLKMVVFKSNYYDRNFNYQIEDEQKKFLDFSITPIEHVHSFDSNSDISKCMCMYRKSLFEEFFSKKIPTNILFLEKECTTKGDIRCLYRIPIF